MNLTGTGLSPEIAAALHSYAFNTWLEILPSIFTNKASAFLEAAWKTDSFICRIYNLWLPFASLAIICFWLVVPRPCRKCFDNFTMCSSNFSPVSDEQWKYAVVCVFPLAFKLYFSYIIWFFHCIFLPCEYSRPTAKRENNSTHCIAQAQFMCSLAQSVDYFKSNFRQ